jgi:triphosphoribosyl-dephospho-CoA synthase
MDSDAQRTAKHVASCLQLGILLEVSAQKPGNVNRTRGFRSTRYEHFLASAVAVEPSLEYAAERGLMVSERKLRPEDIGVGRVIEEAVANTNRWQHGGNTLLGTIILLAPISVAAGMTIARKEELSISVLRKNISVVVESTTPSDAVAAYDAIRLANPSGLVDKAPTLDVNDPESTKRIQKENVTLHDVFKISASYDSISKEWVENYPLTFETGLPYFEAQLKNTASLDVAILHTFLRVLSVIPDTLIARKASSEKAREVSIEAGTVLKLGGATTQAGRDRLSSLDRRLREKSNQYNPGTTADIIAAVLSISILKGFRP